MPLCIFMGSHFNQFATLPSPRSESNIIKTSTTSDICQNWSNRRKQEGECSAFSYNGARFIKNIQFSNWRNQKKHSAKLNTIFSVNSSNYFSLRSFFMYIPSRMKKSNKRKCSPFVLYQWNVHHDFAWNHFQKTFQLQLSEMKYEKVVQYNFPFFLHTNNFSRSW